MLIHEYQAFTIWKMSEAEIERKSELARMIQSEQNDRKIPAYRKNRIQQFVSLLIRKLS
ncbi:hypothetical protein [Cohnella sp. AR92]|uniref:hypothetical protein n=1 Tax=Cohnella sp. AR92 TaxID=648716 RepID=UPI0013154353|nr:hypothetical protein [Cohnella sp. AR92]